MLYIRHMCTPHLLVTAYALSPFLIIRAHSSSFSGQSVAPGCPTDPWRSPEILGDPWRSPEIPVDPWQ
jgi:hypothetical protein